MSERTQRKLPENLVSSMCRHESLCLLTRISFGLQRALKGCLLSRDGWVVEFWNQGGGSH